MVGSEVYHKVSESVCGSNVRKGGRGGQVNFYLTEKSIEVCLVLREREREKMRR